MTTDPLPRAEPTIEERRLAIDERRLALDGSFARKWLPTLATVVIGLIASIFGYVQQLNVGAANQQARIEAKAKDEREWGFKVVEMYFARREIFDLTKNPEEATANLRVLAAVAPTAVLGVLSAEQARIPAPGAAASESQRYESLAAVADIQRVLAPKTEAATAPPATAPSASYLVYIQYPDGAQTAARTAQSTVQKLGFRAPGIEQVANVPSRLQVRYYRPEQRDTAARLAGDVGKALGLPAAADNAILVTSQKQLPAGILELWLPRAAVP